MAIRKDLERPSVPSLRTDNSHQGAYGSVSYKSIRNFQIEPKQNQLRLCGDATATASPCGQASRWQPCLAGLPTYFIAGVGSRVRGERLERQDRTCVLLGLQTPTPYTHYGIAVFRMQSTCVSLGVYTKVTKVSEVSSVQFCAGQFNEFL